MSRLDLRAMRELLVGAVCDLGGGDCGEPLMRGIRVPGGWLLDATGDHPVFVEDPLERDVRAILPVLMEQALREGRDPYSAHADAIAHAAVLRMRIDACNRPDAMGRAAVLAGAAPANTPRRACGNCRHWTCEDPAADLAMVDLPDETRGTCSERQSSTWDGHCCPLHEFADAEGA